jgi:hypothetical protein
VNFGPGTVFEEQATFIKPVGPHEPGEDWAVVLFARTGDSVHYGLFEGVSLHVYDQHLVLLALNAKTGPRQINLPDDIYGAIFNRTNPQPFTLGLLIDRVTGGGRISLKVGSRTFSRDVDFQVFPAGSGPIISSVGPLLGTPAGSGVTASVHVTEFRVLVPSNSSANVTATCPMNWGPNCRAVAETH